MAAEQKRLVVQFLLCVVFGALPTGCGVLPPREAPPEIVGGNEERVLYATRTIERHYAPIVSTYTYTTDADFWSLDPVMMHAAHVWDAPVPFSSSARVVGTDGR